MGISNPFKKKKEVEEKIELPDADEELFEKEEENVIEFVKKRAADKKEAEKKALEAKEKPKKTVETEFPVKKPVAMPFENTVEPEKEEKTTPESYLANEIALYFDEKNVGAAFTAIEEALNAEFSIAIQAGIVITPEKIEELKKIVPWLLEHGYTIVASGQKTERVLNE